MQPVLDLYELTRVVLLLQMIQDQSFIKKLMTGKIKQEETWENRHLIRTTDYY